MRNHENETASGGKQVNGNEAEKTGRILRICEWFALVLTALLPVKFCSFVSTPEAVPLYRFDFASLIFVVWPITFFEIAATVLMILTAICYLLNIRKKAGVVRLPRSYMMYLSAWAILAAVSATGWLNASAAVYAAQMTDYVFGLTAYAASMTVLFCLDGERMRRFSTRALLIGTACAVYSGLRQYFIGFDELEEFLAKQAKEAGHAIVNEQFAVRVAERRVQGDFASCNTYGGFLAGMLSFAALVFWRFGNERVSPPKTSRRLFAGIALAAVGFTLIQTDSRGAFVSLFAALGLAVLCLPMKRNVRSALICAAAAGFAGLAWLIATGRGMMSMFVRFDYWQAALRMMLKHPLTGTGWGDFFHDFEVLRFWQDKEAAHTPHNMLMLFASSCGVPGLAAAAWLLWIPVYQGCRNICRMDWKKQGTIFMCVNSIALLTLFFGLQLDLGFETPAFMAAWVVISLIVLGADSRETELKKKWGYTGAAVLIAAGTAVLPKLCEHTAHEYAAARLEEALDPRFSMNLAVDYEAPPELVYQLVMKAERYAPRDPFIRASYADYLFEHGDAEGAIRNMGIAISRSPQRASFYKSRARYRYFANGCKADDAVRADFAELRRLTPNNPEHQASDEELCQRMEK